jgi:hypothetical protein
MELNEALAIFRSRPSSVEERRRRTCATRLVLQELHSLASRRYSSLIEGLHASDLDDICQDVLIHLFRSNSSSLDSLETVGSARSYLSRAIFNQTNTLFRRQSRVVIEETRRAGEGSRAEGESLAVTADAEQPQERRSRQNYEMLEYEDADPVSIDVSTTAFRRTPAQQLEVEHMTRLFSDFCDYVARQSSSRISTQQNNRQRLQWAMDLQNGVITHEELMSEHELTRGTLDTQISRVRRLLWATLDRIEQRSSVEEHLTSEEESFCESAEILRRWMEWLQSHRSRR